MSILSDVMENPYNATVLQFLAAAKEAGADFAKLKIASQANPEVPGAVVIACVGVEETAALLEAIERIEATTELRAVLDKPSASSEGKAGNDTD
jgi:hypothetical protein